MLDGALRWVVLGIAWGGAAAGVAFSLVLDHRAALAGRGTYLALGWVAVITLPELSERLHSAPLALIAAGGLLYTVGAVVYALAAEPVAARVRLPRGLPRVRYRRRRRATSRRWPAGSSPAPPASPDGAPPGGSRVAPCGCSSATRPWAPSAGRATTRPVEPAAWSS